MSLHSISFSPTFRRLSGLAMGLSVIGLGFSFAQDRGRGGSPQPRERAMPVERPTTMVERPISRPVHTPAPRAGNPGTSSTPGQVPRATPGIAPFRPATNAIITPSPWPRCTSIPNRELWQRRDIMAEIQAMARRGFIAVHPVGEDTKDFTGVSEYPAGWTAYGFRVPPGENLHVRLNHTNEGWFRLAMVNKWGSLEPGMLQNLIPTGNPEVKYTNPTDQVRSVYVIVDDPGWMSSKANPFTMKVTRSWDPTQKKVDHSPIVTGIWAQKKEEPKPDPAAKEVPTEVQPKG